MSAGRIAPEVAEEHPGLALHFEVMRVRAARGDEGLREQLRLLSDGMTGGEAVELRRKPIPHAYRVFFRHVGIDPDIQRTPIEHATVERLLRGAYVSHGLVRDALLVALVETGVPVWALDAETVVGEPTIRPARPGERIGSGEFAHEPPPGRLVVACDDGPVATLFGDVSQQHAVTGRTRWVLVYAVQVPTVPGLFVDEALFVIREALTEAA